MRLVFRILDFDVPRLKKADQMLSRLVKSYGMDAKVIQVNEFLEFGRLGIENKLPVLELNGAIISAKKELTEEYLRNLLEIIIAKKKQET